MKQSGRPTIYGDRILLETREYIDQTEDTEEQQLTGLSQKGTELYKTKIKVNLPSIEGLALHLGIDKDTIYSWRKEEGKEPFSELIRELLAKQARELLNKGLSGDYNPTIVKVLLTKHGYREGIEQTGKDGKDFLPETTNEVRMLAKQLDEFEQTRRIGGASNGSATDSLDKEIRD